MRSLWSECRFPRSTELQADYWLANCSSGWILCYHHGFRTSSYGPKCPAVAETSCPIPFRVASEFASTTNVAAVRDWALLVGVVVPGVHRCRVGTRGAWCRVEELVAHGGCHRYERGGEFADALVVNEAQSVEVCVDGAGIAAFGVEVLDSNTEEFGQHLHSPSGRPAANPAA